jgi:ATP-binding cassette subfamily B protein
MHAYVGATRVATVLNTPPEIAATPSNVALPAGPGRLELRDVSVSNGEEVLLDQLHLTVPAGASVAVVGRSGTGKTVLVSLIGRLLDPQHGEIRIDGTPICATPLPELRRTVAYAFERPALLGATIHDIIAYARPDASRAQVVQAARAAQADHFIRRLPEGYSTPLDEVRLSGGEIQRLGLARAILSTARIMVLDDATSSLDTATEVKVAQALTQNLAGRTSLVVTHRPATAARVDLVAWLDGGRIRALAPHAQLWTDSDYRHLFTSDAHPVPELAVSGR